MYELLKLNTIVSVKEIQFLYCTVNNTSLATLLSQSLCIEKFLSSFLLLHGQELFLAPGGGSHQLGVHLGRVRSFKSGAGAGAGAGAGGSAAAAAGAGAGALSRD